MSHKDIARKLGSSAPWITEQTLRVLTPNPQIHDLTPGTTLPRTEPADTAWLVLSGELESWAGNARTGTYRRGSLVGGAAALGGRRPDQIAVVDAAAVLPIESVRLQDALDMGGELGTALLAAVTAEAQARAEGISDALVRLTHQPFGGSTQLPPPPYSTGHAKVRVIAVEWPQRLESELPPRVRRDDRLALLVIARLQHIRPAQAVAADGPEYTEAGLLLPVLVDHADGHCIQGYYTPWAWPNNLMSLFTGREMFGLAKRYGNVYEFAGERPRAVLRAGGGVGIDLRFSHLGPEDLASRADDVQKLLGAISPGDYTDGTAWPVDAVEARLRAPRHVRARERYHDCTSARAREQFKWPVECQDAARALRMLKTATRHPKLLPDLVNAIPEALRSHSLLAWQRQFHAHMPGRPGTRVWDASQFAKDAITSSRMELRTLEKLEWFELTSGTDPIYLFGSTSLRLVPATGLGVRIRGVFVHHAGDVELDYREAPGLDADERKRLAVTFAPEKEVAYNHTHRPQPDPLPSYIRAILGERSSRHVRRGDAIFQQGQGEGTVAWYVESGEVDEWRGDAYLGRRVAGDLVGEVGHFEHVRSQRVTSAIARTDAIVRPVHHARLQALRDNPETNRTITEHVLEHAQAWADHAGHDLDVATRQVFTDNRARFAPGPYMGAAEMFSIPCIRPPDGHIEMRMPPRMRWHDGLPMCVLLITRFTGFRPTWAPDDSPGISYCETGLFVPTQVRVEGRWQFRAYFSWLFPSNIMASFVGRELYGYPKRYANTRIEDDRLLLRVDGQTALDIPYQLDELAGRRPLKDAAHLFTAAGMPYDQLLRKNQSLERDLEWKRHVAWGPREPLRASLRGSVLGPLRLATSLLRGAIPWHPIPMAGWRRSFAPTAQIPEWALSDSGTWTPEAFDVDALVGSSFRVRDLQPDSMRSIQLQNGGRDLCLSLPGETPRPLTPLHGAGVRCCFELEMGVEPGVLDFRSLDLDADERARLDFGPNARRRFGE